MPTSDVKPVPPEANFACRECNSHDIEFYVWESSDGAHEDHFYHCLGCNRRWVVEGSDY